MSLRQLAFPVLRLSGYDTAVWKRKVVQAGTYRPAWRGGLTSETPDAASCFLRTAADR